jgi:hypothetical protein
MSHYDYGYICSDCAEALGGVPPEGHVATCHIARCEKCRLEKDLSHHDDWNWPGQIEYSDRD